MAQSPPERARVDLGLVLIALGILGILWGVFHLLGNVHGPDGPPRTFAERTSYNEAKGNIHRVFPGALLRALPGLALAMYGASLRRSRGAPRRP